MNYKGFNPKNLDENWWYYLNQESIDVIHEIRVDGRYIRTDEKRIPLRALLRALGKSK